MSKRPPRGTTSRKRAVVLTGIAITLGGAILAARYFDDLTRPPDGDGPDPPLGRRFATALASPLQNLEWFVFDKLHIWPPGRKTPADADVVVLGIDDASMDIVNTAFPEDIESERSLQLMREVYPWSREVYARLVDRLVQAGARTVLIDLVLGASHAEHPEGDRLFHECLERNAGHVVLAADLIWKERAVAGTDIVEKQRTVLLPHDSLVAHQWPADRRVGFATYFPEVDDKVRGTVLQAMEAGLPERTLPSFALAALRLEGRADGLPSDEGRHLLRLGEAADYAPVPLHEVLTPALWESNYANGASFKDKTIFLGHVARQQQDFHHTTVGELAGVRVHAQIYAALKAREFLRETPLPAAMLVVALAAALAALIVARGRLTVLATLVFSGVMVSGVAAQQVLYNHAALVWHASTPLLAFGFVGVCGFTYDFVLERRQKVALKRSLLRFHSPDVAEHIVEHPELYFSIREGAERHVVVLFSDVRGFTSISEQLSARKMVAQLNEYFERMVAVVFENKGAVDKFIGDALMAVWGRFRDKSAETEFVADACNAVAAALAMRAALARLNENWRSRGMIELAFGIGIHQGDAVAGEIGSQERAEMTVIGDSVNLGSRLEGATKEYGLDLLISEPVHRRVADRFLCRSADLLRVKGKKKPVEVFAVIGPADTPPPRGLELFEEGMRFYREGRFQDALWLFQQAAKDGLDDALTRTFITRCEDLVATPPAAWDGVWTMTKK